MPLFGNKFSPKKPSLRKHFANNNSTTPLKLFDKDNNTKLVLGDYTLIFKNGKWTLDSGGEETVEKSHKKLNTKIQNLEEENNLLKLKLEVLMDMLAETTIESQIKEKEIEKLKKK